MASFVSAQFEIDDLSGAEPNTYRVITKALDQGNVPPSPSSSYFPTQPDDHVNFVVVEFLGDTLGENFDRVANLSDIESLDVRPLDTFEVDSGIDLQAEGVEENHILRVYKKPEELWTSGEYPGTEFNFIISSVDTSHVTLFTSIPAHDFGLSWDIRNSSGDILTSGSEGITRRNGIPAASSTFLDSRFNAYFTDVSAALNHRASVKAGLDALANESTELQFSLEKYTAKPQ